MLRSIRAILPPKADLTRVYIQSLQVDSSGTIDQIYSDIQTALDARLASCTSLPQSSAASTTTANADIATAEVSAPAGRSVKLRVPGETPKPRNVS